MLNRPKQKGQVDEQGMKDFINSAEPNTEQLEETKPVDFPSKPVKADDERVMRTHRYLRSSWLKLKYISDSRTHAAGKLVSIESVLEEALQLLFAKYHISDAKVKNAFEDGKDELG